MTAIAHHVLLAVTVLALGAAGLRAGAALGGRGLGLAVAAFPLAAGFAVLSALALGLVDLGGSPIALSLAAGLGYLLARRWLAAVAVTPSLARGERMALGAVLGAGAAWVAWVVKHPALGVDPLTYHLPEAVRFAQQGTPGSVEEVVYEFPVGAYPLVNEVLTAWGLAVGSSFAWALALVPLCSAAFALAAWAGLRALSVGRWTAALAIASILLIPIAATQQFGPHTDLPALAWLACTATLALLSREEPRLLAAAFVAFGLAIGTKTTAAPLAVAALAPAVWHARPSLRRPVVLAGATAGGLLGGLWYVRNWIDHGSPLWPFKPGDDPVPPLFARIDDSFLQDPGSALEAFGPHYPDLLGGGLLLLVAPLLAVALSRRPAVLAAAGAAALAILLWTLAPFTGAPEDPVFADLKLTTVRYLFPALSAGALALCLTRRPAATALLGLAALISLQAALALRFPGTPSLALLALGAVAGIALSRLRIRIPAVAAALVLGLAGALAADGLVRRHGAVGRLDTSGVVSFLAPRLEQGEAPVASAPIMLGVLAGDRLQHEIELIPRDEPCARVRARRGWIVIGTPSIRRGRVEFTAGECLAGERPAFDDGAYRVYALTGR